MSYCDRRSSILGIAFLSPASRVAGLEYRNRKYILSLIIKFTLYFFILLCKDLAVSFPVPSLVAVLSLVMVLAIASRTFVMPFIVIPFPVTLLFVFFALTAVSFPSFRVDFTPASTTTTTATATPSIITSSSAPFAMTCFAPITHRVIITSTTRCFVSPPLISMTGFVSRSRMAVAFVPVVFASKTRRITIPSFMVPSFVMGIMIRAVTRMTVTMGIAMIIVMPISAAVVCSAVSAVISSRGIHISVLMPVIVAVRMMRTPSIIAPSIIADIFVSSMTILVFVWRVLLLLPKRIFGHCMVGLFSIPLIEPIPDLGDTLAEIDFDSSIVYQGIVHFEVRLRCLFLGSELYKGILEGGSRLLVPHNVHRNLFVKARKNKFQVFVFGDRVELANKEDVFGCRNVGRGQISEHFEHHGSRFVFAFQAFLLHHAHFLGIFGIFFVDIGRGNPDFHCLFWRTFIIRRV
mmetsp:Transcript_19421/g.48393  ORF Transcript_19421/g.48393 Transcript_19421/m.48393 type:complete len:462 (-) Transcript_19421:843-2228(-)